MKNSEFIDAELKWMSSVIAARINSYFNNEAKGESTSYPEVIHEITPPEAKPTFGRYAAFICENHLGFEDRLYLALAVIPDIQPQLFDCFCIKNSTGRHLCARKEHPFSGTHCFHEPSDTP